MKFLYDDKPIIALSSGTNNSALAIVRISGFENLSLFSPFFSIDLSSLKPNFSTFVRIVNGEKIVDECVITFFKGPNSYNGENILELSIHGNQLNVARVISLFVDSKLCRLAGPGEFTYRALQNKKLTLSQVEGLDLLLNAQSDLMLDQGLATLSGALHREFLELQASYLKLKAAVELSIDFLEDIGESQSNDLLKNSFDSFYNRIVSLHQRTRGNLSQLTSPSIVLLGQTNAGKSSLFNHFLNNSRSIVSSIAGTTRDYVSEYLNIDGTNFRLVDTAGIRNADDVIESIGIDRTFEQISTSFFSILVVNPFETDLASFSSFDFGVDCIVITHSDMPQFEERFLQLKNIIPNDVQLICCSLASDNYGPIEPAQLSGPIEPNFETGPIGPKHLGGPIGPDSLSGSIGPVGVGQLLTSLKLRISKKYSDLSANDPILIDRHRASISSVYDKTLEFRELMSFESDIAILSSELNLIGGEISQLIGIITVDDVLSSIFSNFCIGK